MSLCEYQMLYSRFDDDCESVSPLSVEEPVDQVAGHLRRSRVQMEEPHIISCKQNI